MGLNQLMAQIAFGRKSGGHLLLFRLALFCGAFWILSNILITILIWAFEAFGNSGPRGLSLIDVLRHVPNLNIFKYPIALPFYISVLASLYMSYRIARSQLATDVYGRILETAKTPNVDVELSPLGVLPLIFDLELRLVRLQARANLIITIVIMSLISAVFLIIFAGRLTSIDAAAVSNIQNIKEEVWNLDGQITTLSATSARLVQQKAQKAAVSAKGSEPARPLAEKALSAGDSLSDGDPEDTLAGLKEEKKFLIERREIAAHLLDQAWANESTETTKDKLKDTNYITATFFTRIGILVILIFLVQILISLYKYNTRMIAFYASRLDCLRIWNGSADELQTLLPLLTPTNVDFGPDARHPIQYFLEAWRQRKKGEGTDRKVASVRPKSDLRSARSERAENRLPQVSAARTI